MAQWPAVGTVLVFLVTGAANASCPNFPYTFSNGSTADANQVNSDFSNVITCFAPFANPSFSGNVGIGTASPFTTLEVLNSGPGGSAPANSGTTDPTVDQRIHFGIVALDVGILNNGVAYIQDRQAANLGINYNLELQPNGGYVGIGVVPLYTLQVNGQAAGTSAWINLSDARLKTNIEEISGALDMVTRLRGVRFQWRQPAKGEPGADLNLPQNTSQIGFVAQEVQAVVPAAVVAPKPGSDGLYGLKEADLIPVLVEAIKEQQVEIQSLKGEVADLRKTNPPSR